MKLPYADKIFQQPEKNAEIRVQQANGSSLYYINQPFRLFFVSSPGSCKQVCTTCVSTKKSR